MGFGIQIHSLMNKYLKFLLKLLFGNEKLTSLIITYTKKLIFKNNISFC